MGGLFGIGDFAGDVVSGQFDPLRSAGNIVGRSRPQPGDSDRSSAESVDFTGLVEPVATVATAGVAAADEVADDLPDESGDSEGMPISWLVPVAVVVGLVLVSRGD